MPGKVATALLVGCLTLPAVARAQPAEERQPTTAQPPVDGEAISAEVGTGSQEAVSSQETVSQETASQETASGETASDEAGAEEEGDEEVDAATSRRTQSMALLAGARRLFRQGDFRAAIVLLERAYAMTGESRYLFNLGAAHHGAGHCELARTYYEQYLRREPSGAGRAEALNALDYVYARCGHAPQVDQARRVLSWGLVGLGAAAGLASVASFALLRETQHEYDSRPVYDPLEEQALRDNGKRYQTYTLVLGATSGLLLAAGATLLVLPAGEQGQVQMTSAGLPGISYSTTF